MGQVLFSNGDSFSSRAARIRIIYRLMRGISSSRVCGSERERAEYAIDSLESVLYRDG